MTRLVLSKPLSNEDRRSQVTSESMAAVGRSLVPDEDLTDEQAIQHCINFWGCDPRDSKRPAFWPQEQSHA